MTESQIIELVGCIATLAYVVAFFGFRRKKRALEGWGLFFGMLGIAFVGFALSDVELVYRYGFEFGFWTQIVLILCFPLTLLYLGLRLQHWENHPAPEPCIC